MSRAVPCLSAIAGQDAAVGALAALVRPEPVPPLLLHGPEGVGKRTAAIAFAAALVCRQPHGADACGACPPCRRVAEAGAVTELREGSTSADAALVLPDVGLVGIPKGKTRLSVVQARDIVLSMSASPYELPRRIYVVDPADKLNASAANSLLKVLEEPPAYGVLILVTAAPWSLPITVRSRLRAIRFRPLPDELVERLLVEGGAAPDEARARAARAQGSLARAVAGDPEAESALVEMWVRALERLAAGGRPAELAAAASEDVGKNAGAAEEALGLLVGVLRDVAAGASGAPPALLDDAQMQRLAPAAERLLGPTLERPGLVDRLRREIGIFNRNPRLTVEGAILALAGQLRERDFLG